MQSTSVLPTTTPTSDHDDGAEDYRIYVVVQDERPGAHSSGGPAIYTFRARDPLSIGDRIRMPDGVAAPVVSSQTYFESTTWVQAIAVGDL